MPKRVKKTVLNSESREFVIRLRDYFEQESQNGGPLLPVTQVRQRVAEALGTGLATVTRVSSEKFGKEGDEENKLLTPHKKRRRIQPVVDVDDFQIASIRNHIYGYYSRKELPTLDKLIKTLSETDLYNGGRSSLSKLLNNIGFHYQKSNKRKFIMERTDITLKRVDFLRKVKEVVDWDKIVFLDETWLNANHTVGKTWNDDTAHSSTKVPEGKGERLIICHAGTCKGFIPNCLLAFKSKKTNEYHEEMNFQTFSKWFYKMMDNLNGPHIIIMDNASYHSVQLNKAPTSANKKAELVEWLISKGIDVDITMLKCELLRLVATHKPKEPTYELDEAAKQRGHTVIRLPPYHCQYNAIEMIWSQIKGYAARNNTTPPFTANKMLRLLEEACDQVTAENWANVVRHVKEEIMSDWMRDIHFDNLLENELIIQVGGDDTSSSDFDDEDLGCTHRRTQLLA